MNYDSRNRLDSHSDTQGPSRGFTYDDRGNVTGAGTQFFTYDYSDQPVSISGSASGIYEYDGNKKRVKSVVDGKTIYNVFDASGALVHIDNITDSEKTDYIAGGGQTLARIVKNAAGNDDYTYLHPDHLGSAQTGTTILGAVSWREQYSPFGERLSHIAVNDNKDGYTGHIFDKATGLNYMQARYYDPLIGRFLSIDPVGFEETGEPGMFNRYAYVLNDPVNMTDPTGACPWCIPAAIWGYRAYKAGRALQAANKAAQVTAIAATAVAGHEAIQAVTSDNASGDGSRPLGALEPIDAPGHNQPRPELEELTDEELVGAVTKPKDGQRVKVRGNEVRDGNGRVKEMKRRGFAPDTEIPVEELPDDSGEFPELGEREPEPKEPDR